MGALASRPWEGAAALVGLHPPMSDPAIVDARPDAERAAPRMVTGRFLIVTLATFCYFLSLGSLLPTIPKYVEDVLGGNGFEVGLVVGVFAVSAAIVRPWAGRLGDRYGRRVLLSGGSLLVGVVTLAYTQVDAVAGLVGLRLITGLGEAAVFVGAATATQDMAPSHRRGEAASYFSVALYSGLALGPALGEHLANTYGYDEVWHGRRRWPRSSRRSSGSGRRPTTAGRMRSRRRCCTAPPSVPASCSCSG